MRPIPNSPAYDDLRRNPAFRLGWEAAYSINASDTENPFAVGTPQHSDWALGFKRGFTHDTHCTEAEWEAAEAREDRDEEEEEPDHDAMFDEYEDTLYH